MFLLAPLQGLKMTHTAEIYKGRVSGRHNFVTPKAISRKIKTRHTAELAVNII